MPFKYLLSLFLTWQTLAAAESATEIRVMTWNIHHGVGEDGKLDLERIAKVIAAQKPDLVALQEVDKNCGRSGKIDQAAVLAKLTGLNQVFGKAMSFDGGEYGQAVLSAHPIQESKVIRLPGSGEPRIALDVRVNIGGKPARFTSVHLDHMDAANRQAQVKALLKELADDSLPIILAGDFNDVPGSGVIQALESPWLNLPKTGTGLTSPAMNPEKEIDYIFIRGWASKTKAEVVSEAVASDHRPVLATVISEPEAK